MHHNSTRAAEQHLSAPQSPGIHQTDSVHVCVFTLRPPVFSFMGVRKGSKIMWLVSMLTGDCLFPTEHRFQAEFTSPQNDGTVTQKDRAGVQRGEQLQRTDRSAY